MSEKKTHVEEKPLFTPQEKKTTNNANIVSSIGKRKYNDAFDADTFDDARFGQHISAEFFREYDKKVLTSEEELLKWCQYYLNNKDLNNKDLFTI